MEIRRLLTATLIGVAMVGMTQSKGLAEESEATKAIGQFIESAKARAFHDKIAKKVRWAGAAKLSVMDAIKAATGKVSGDVVEAELQASDGVLVWAVEIVTAEHKLVTVFVDPQSGVVIVGQPLGGAEPSAGGGR